MKNKIALSLMTLVLCMSVFFVPLTAYAASDTTPPDCDAWLTGDTVHIEASDDDSGVDAVYIDGQRVNYLVNGAVEVKLKDYAGTAEKVGIYAVDFAGNKSVTVEIKNPYYQKPPATPAPTPTSAPSQPQTPAPTAPSTTPPASSSQSSGGSSGSTSRPSTSQPPASSSSTSEPTESAIPDSNPLTPEGQAGVVDNATEDEGKEFFTFETPDGNVFYLVVDRQREGQNVYFLSAVTEQDLLALAEGDGSTPGESAIPTPQPDPEPQPTPDPQPQPEPEPEKESGGGIGTILLIVVAVLGVGGAGYYFKVLKPRQQAALDDADGDFEDDEYGEDMDFGAEDEYLPDDDGYPDKEMEDSADAEENEQE